MMFFICLNLNVFQLIHKFCVVCFFVDRGWLLFLRMLYSFSGGVRNNLDPWRKVNFHWKKKTRHRIRYGFVHAKFVWELPIKRIMYS